MEETIALSIFSTIIVLYFCGLLFGTFTVGIWICFALSILFGIYAVMLLIKERGGVKYCLTPGTVVFLVFFLYVWWLNRGRRFSIWDEFSHWGLVVKNMYIFDYFGNHPDSTVTFRGYPPATALWQYFVAKICGEFKEEYAYQAMGWLMSSLLLPVLKKFNWKRMISACFSVSILAMIPLVFNYLYPVSLLVDIILGLLLGYLLVSSYYEEKRDCFSILNASFAIMVLCLTKASGAFLGAVYVVIVIIYDIIAHKKIKEKEILVSWGIHVLALLIGKFSWSIYLNISSTNPAWQTSSLNLANIMNLLEEERNISIL